MLRDLKDLEGYALRATDGDIGTIKDFYFDDDRWVVRYLVVETGSWLSSRQVLVSPISLGLPNHADKVVPVSITLEQVRDSPDVDTDKPVSRQHETDYLGYYGYPVYWDSIGLWGTGSMPGMMVPDAAFAPTGSSVEEADRAIVAEEESKHRDDDPHLRSCRNVTGYHIKVEDGEIGHVKGWIVDEDSWQIRYLVVDTGNWLPGRRVLIAPPWIAEVSWVDAMVSVRMTRDSVRHAPEWNASAPPDRDQEVEIYRHYDRTGYW